MEHIKEYENFINGGKSYLKQVKPKKYLYHTSNPMFRDKISKEGLIPKGRSESWLSDTKIDGEVIFAVTSNKDDYIWDSTYDDVYQIDTSRITNTWYNDPNFGFDRKHIITFEPIPKSSIKLIYRGTGESTQ